MRLYKIIYLLVYFLFFCTNVHTANYYVDNTASGSNNGTSWTNAWKSFSDINWSSLGAGDTLFISGGTSSKIYTEELSIQASGNANNDLVIRAGLDSGHNGEVIIKRGRTSSVWGININGASTKREYITVQKLTVTESSNGILIAGNATGERVNVITLDSLTVSQWGKTSGTYMALSINGGWDASDTTEHIDSIFITNCDISLIDSIQAQTDAVQAKFAQNIVFDNTDIYLDNRSYVLNSNEPGHNDNIQVYGDAGNVRVGVYNLTVTNCTLTNLAGVDSVRYTAAATAHGHIIQSEDIGGDYIIYNNIINAPFFYGYGAVIFEKLRHFGDGEKYIIIHNTITGRQTLRMLELETESNPQTSSPHIIKNNIFYSDTLAHDNFQYGTPSAGDYENAPLMIFKEFANWNQVDGNLYSTYCYRGSSGAIWGSRWGSAYVTSNGGESSGDLANRYLVDPLFVQYTRAGWPDGTLGNYDFHLQSGSPAINEGADLQSYIESLGLSWVDKDGVARDSTPDCGAYQYVP